MFLGRTVQTGPWKGLETNVWWRNSHYYSRWSPEKEKKWNNQTYNILKHQTNVLGVKGNIIIPILRFRFWGQGMCFHPCCIWYCNLWYSNRKRYSPDSLPRAAPFLFPSPPVKFYICYSPKCLCCVYLNIRLYCRLNVDAYLKQVPAFVNTLLIKKPRCILDSDWISVTVNSRTEK